MVDVDFTNVHDLDTGGMRDPMSRDDIAVEGGAFETGSNGDRIEGRFYGSDHEEVGGVFERDQVLGAFGASCAPAFGLGGVPIRTCP